MTGLRFLFRVTLRRLDLASDICHLREPQKIPQVMSPDETRRLLAVANSLKVRVLLSLGYGCGLRAGEVVRLKAKHIDSAQKIIQKLNKQPTALLRLLLLKPASCSINKMSTAHLRQAYSASARMRREFGKQWP
jgi:site-specific recombinase XerD